MFGARTNTVILCAGERLRHSPEELLQTYLPGIIGGCVGPTLHYLSGECRRLSPEELRQIYLSSGRTKNMSQ